MAHVCVCVSIVLDHFYRSAGGGVDVRVETLPPAQAR